MTPGEFAAKWRGITTSERAAAQSHFIDLCRVLGELAPTDADPEGTWYAFEKGAEKLQGGDGVIILQALDGTTSASGDWTLSIDELVGDDGTQQVRLAGPWEITFSMP